MRVSVSNWTIALLVPGPRVLRLLQTPGAFIYVKVFQVVASERNCRLQIEMLDAFASHKLLGHFSHEYVFIFQVR
jgi:hypothetical protein